MACAQQRRLLLSNKYEYAHSGDGTHATADYSNVKTACRIHRQQVPNEHGRISACGSTAQARVLSASSAHQSPRGQVLLIAIATTTGPQRPKNNYFQYTGIVKLQYRFIFDNICSMGCYIVCVGCGISSIVCWAEGASLRYTCTREYSTSTL